MSFGERLQQVLDAKSMTRADLCRLTGLKSSNLVPYMKKDPERSPKLSTALLIADALDVSLDFLAGRTDEMFRKPSLDRLDEVETELIENYRESEPQWRKNITMTARAAAGESKEGVEDSVSAVNDEGAA